MRFRPLVVILGMALLWGCGVAPVELMPTPVVFHGTEFDPFLHTDEQSRQTSAEVLYATDRAPVVGRKGVKYSNRRVADLHVGTATVRFGHEQMTWEELVAESRKMPRDQKVQLTLDAVVAETVVPGIYYGLVAHEMTPGQRIFIDSVNDHLESAQYREICIYVHGAKVDFYNACAYAANIAHFAGREFVPIAYAWGTHQNIFAYLSGNDVEEAWAAGDKLSALLLFLADHTTVQHINIIGYSAGGRVVREALVALRHRFAELSGHDLRERLRIGAVLLAAPDVPISAFARDVAAMHATADQLIITMSDADEALEMAERVMRHEPRIGVDDEKVLEVVEVATSGLDRIEFIDVSAGRELRGFDITGHHYWHSHPWVWSDVLILMRTRLPAAERGLTPGGHPKVWELPPDYPDRAREAMRRYRENAPPGSFTP